MPPPKKTPDAERQLMIKTKTCERLLKEVAYYKKEAQENEEKLQQMKDNERDPYDIKKFHEVLDESYMMIPDSKSRLDKSLEDLSTFLSSSSSFNKNSNDNDETSINNATNSSEWYSKAQSLLKEHYHPENGEEVQKTNVDDLQEDEVF